MTSFDALLVAGFGGPESMAEVPDFLQRVSGGPRWSTTTRASAASVR